MRLPPWVSNGEALVWPGMKDMGFGKEVLGDLRDPLPCGAIGPTAPLERAPPKIDDMETKGRNARAIARYGVISEVT